MGERTSRIGSLDGLRGVAALVVLVHHTFASIGPLGDVYFGRSAQHGLEWLVYSPLHLIWAGPEAVYVFFILSGLVLTLPALRRSYDWKAYYPSRLIRLYLPVVVAVVFAVACALVIPRAGAVGHGIWMERQEQGLSLFSVVRNMTLLSPDWLNPPLWSLRWEVAFSVLLPAYLFVVKRASRFWLLLVLGAVAVSAVGTAIGDKGILIYLPMFLIGSALAVGLQSGGWPAERYWPWLMGLGLLGITSSWWLPPMVGDGNKLAAPIVLVSAFLIVAGSIRWGGARRVLESGVVRWFGRISFSLYLTHDPIVVAVNTLLPVHLTVLTPLIAIPLALMVAVVFFRFVEAPAHVLAKKVATALAAQRVAQTGQPTSRS